tara:strand:+ start:355 stop:1839 length:1485 start_codon:yes stop_codon:yes gene_type:complete
MPAQVTIQFEDTNPDGAASEDGYFVWRAVGTDPVPDVANPPATAFATVQGATSGSGSTINHVDNSILPNRQYYYRLGFYRGGGTNPQPLTVSELSIGAPIGPISVPDSSHLGYPNNVPDEVSGVLNTVNTEPLFHLDARQWAIDSGWDPAGGGSLYDSIRDNPGNAQVPNKADSYSAAASNWIGDFTSGWADRVKDLYLWHGEDSSKPLIPVYGDRNTVYNWPYSNNSQAGLTRPGFRNNFPNVADPTTIDYVLFDEGITMFIVASTSGSMQSTNPARQPGLQNNRPDMHLSHLYGHSSYDVNNGDGYYWSSKAQVNPADHRANASDTRAHPQFEFGGDLNADSGGVRVKSAEPWTTPYGNFTYPAPVEYTHTTADTVNTPRNLNITASQMSPKGGYRLWLNGGVDNSNNPILAVNDATVAYTAESGITDAGIMPGASMGGNSLGFDTPFAVISEILFFPKQLSAVEFGKVTTYLEGRWVDYIPSQGTYNNKLS